MIHLAIQKTVKFLEKPLNLRQLNKKLERYESCLKLSQKHGLLPDYVTCICGEDIRKYIVITRKDGRKEANFRCKCGLSVNVRKTMLSHIFLSQFYMLLYCFINFFKYEQIIKETLE